MLNKRKNLIFVKSLNNMVWDLPTPSSITLFWNFGFCLGTLMVFQIISGLLLSFHYTSFSTESFDSVLKIMRDIWFGWLIRFMHMNMASMIFFFLYVHMFRGLFYFSSVNKNLWMSGVSIMIILMAISFLGYVLPWGQMSFWGVAVITNLFSIIPIFGLDLVNLLWGSFSVSSPTLIRFYSFHFLFPFVLVFFIFIHLILLHEKGSSNSLGISSNLDKILFQPFFFIKDIFFMKISMLILFIIIFFYPFVLGDPVNNIPSMPMSTPTHIKPEWYFMVSYAILRSFSSKVMGVLFLALSVSVFFILPTFTLKFSIVFMKIRSFLFFFYVSIFLFLMKLGSLPAEDPYIEISKYMTFLYFFFLMSIFI